MYILSCLSRTVLKKGKIEIDYFDKFKCLQICWSGKISPEEYKEIMYQLLDLTQQFKIEFWIFDAREEDHCQLYDPEWSLNFFGKEVVKHSIKKIGRIAGGDFHHETKLSEFVTGLIKKHELPYKFKYLDDTNHAISWFLEEEIL